MEKARGLSVGMTSKRRSSDRNAAVRQKSASTSRTVRRGRLQYWNNNELQWAVPSRGRGGVAYVVERLLSGGRAELVELLLFDVVAAERGQPAEEGAPRDGAQVPVAARALVDAERRRRQQPRRRRSSVAAGTQRPPSVPLHGRHQLKESKNEIPIQFYWNARAIRP